MKITLSITVIVGLLFLGSCKRSEDAGENLEIMDDSKIDSTLWESTNYESDLSAFEKYDSALYDQILDTIWFSEKVQDHFGDLNENNYPYLKMVESDSEREDEIVLKILEDSGGVDIIYFKFFILPKDDWRIYYCDTLTDTRIPFKEWTQM